MNQKVILYLVLAALFFSIGGITLIIIIHDSGLGKVEQFKMAPSAAQGALSAKRIKISNTDTGTLSDRIQVEQFLVRPRIFGSFNLKCVYETLFFNTHIEMFPKQSNLRRNNKENTQRLDNIIDRTTNILVKFAALKDIKQIKIIKIKRFNIVQHSRNRNLFILNANYVTGDIQKKQLIFKDCSIQYGSKRVESKNMIWDSGKKLFFIPGRYLIKIGDFYFCGQRSYIDSRLNLKPFGPLKRME